MIYRMKQTIKVTAWTCAWMIALLLGFGIVLPILRYSISLGWSFWSITLPALLVFAEVGVWTRTRRGLVYWLGVGLVAASPVAGIGFWLPLLGELLEEIRERAKEGARESLGTVRIQVRREEA